MRRHVRVGAVDLRVVEAGFDDGGFGVVRHDKLRDAADRLERADVGVDPVGKRLRPARLGEGEARRPQHGDENLRHADLAGKPTNDDRNAVASVIDEQPLAGGMRLPHRHRQGLFEGAIKLAEPRVAIAARVLGDDPPARARPRRYARGFRNGPGHDRQCEHSASQFESLLDKPDLLGGRPTPSALDRGDDFAA